MIHAPTEVDDEWANAPKVPRAMSSLVLANIPVICFCLVIKHRFQKPSHTLSRSTNILTRDIYSLHALIDVDDERANAPTVPRAMSSLASANIPIIRFCLLNYTFSSLSFIKINFLNFGKLEFSDYGNSVFNSATYIIYFGNLKTLSLSYDFNN